MTFKQKNIGAVVTVLLCLLLLLSIMGYKLVRVERELDFTENTLMVDSSKITNVYNDAMAASSSWSRAILWMMEDQILKQGLVNESGQKLTSLQTPAVLFSDAEERLKRVEIGLKDIRIHRDNLSEQEAARMQVLRDTLERVGKVAVADGYKLLQVAAKGEGSLQQIHIEWQQMQWQGLLDVLDEMETISQKVSRSNLAVVLEHIGTASIVSLTLGAFIFILIGGVLLWQMRFISRLIGGQMERLFRHIDHISKDDFSHPIRYRPGMEHSLVALLSKLQDRLRAAKEMMVENARIRVALDASSANVMLVDERRQISFVNRSLRSRQPHLANHQDKMALDSVLDRQQVETLCGSNSPQKLELKLDGKDWVLQSNSVNDEKGGRLGVVIEWTDRTAELQVERDIEQVIHAITLGDFEKRVNESGKTGFHLMLAEQLNSLTQTVAGVVGEVADLFGKLADGDLRMRMNGQYQGLFAELRDNCNDSLSKLEQMVGQMREAATTINGAAKEIATGNANLSSRTEQQAASLEETAASMEELTSTVKHNADNARQADQLARNASTAAGQGGEMVARVVNTMGRITQSAKKVADITAVIDSIAFQTNILALNAAVEAARAGEQGRGFAVVASEVRNLAQRSAEAAKEIGSLIGESVVEIESGAALVQDAGGTMDELVKAVSQVAEIVQEIAQACVEQSSGIQQVNQAVTHMDENTQQNAAMVEQAAAAAVSLQDQANSLYETAVRFSVTGANGGGIAVAANTMNTPMVSKRANKKELVADVEGDWETF
ncbi:methyl-accepting chemotaxis protein [Chromobacterium amazonense]|uniref:methyl-accepting chemotaxis protein n=1 Tax=Chromobacterium amazonense TaxID=1382803 RepID=UPI0031F5F69D